jgi:hypothetical protein
MVYARNFVLKTSVSAGKFSANSGFLLERQGGRELRISN